MANGTPLLYIADKITNPASQANVERLFKSNPSTAGEDDPFLKNAKEHSSEPEFQEKMNQGMLAIGHGTMTSISANQISLNTIPNTLAINGNLSVRTSYSY
jgi:hypothetical protein